MVGTVIGAKEIAGATSTNHVAQILVIFTGGAANIVSAHYSETYTWSFSSTYGSGGVVNNTIIPLTFPASTTLSPSFSGTEVTKPG